MNNRRPWHARFAATFVSIPLLIAGTLLPATAQTAGQPVLVIEGGRLIDGTGRAPIDDSIIVIRGNRFDAIGRRGEVPIPAGAQIYDAHGKTVLPGFIDGHCHLEAFWGEVYLHLGVTTCVQIEAPQNGPWSLAQKEGTELGKIRGPRIWATGLALGRREGVLENESARGWRNYMEVPNEDAAREIVRKKKADGYDALKISEYLAPNLIKAATDEAHKLGMSAVAHSWDAIMSAENGVDGVEHMWSVGYTSIRDAAKRNQLAEDRTAGKIDAEQAGALYDVNGFDVVIDSLVKHHVAFTPTLPKWYRPLAESGQRFWDREQDILNNPNANLPPVVYYWTEFTKRKLFSIYKPEQLEQAKIGYAKAKEFIRRFVAAGGILKEGSDPTPGMAALLMHEAMAMDVEAGVPPMTAIEAATINVARVFRKDKDYGSVETGKVADLSIIEGDPLADIWMTQNVKMVVMDGKLVDPAFTHYVNPIPEFSSYRKLPDQLDVDPPLLTQGEGPTTIRILAKGVGPYHEAYLDGHRLETKFISRSELQATVPPELIADVGTYKVTIRSKGEPVAESPPAPLVVKFKK